MALLEGTAEQISLATNGLEGIEMLKNSPIHAVLSDERMPKKTGLEVLRWMRENNLDIPFIIHSGYSQKELVEEARRLGVYAFFDKPWDERFLIRTVEEALQAGVEKKKT